MADLDPCITFQVNLITQEVLSHLSPDRHQTDQDKAIDDINARSDSRSTWLPWATFGGRVLQHGEKFTVCGREAIRIRDTYVNVDDPSLVLCDPDPEPSCVVDLGEERIPPIELIAATGTTIMIPVFLPVQVTTGEGYLVNAELAVVGGTSTETAVITVDSAKTIAGQIVTNFNGAEDNGTFSGGTGYAMSDSITMTDGSVITVSEVSGGVVTGFTISSNTTPGSIAGNNITLTQSFASGEPSGTGFTITLGQRNQQIFSTSYKQAAEITLGKYTVLPTDPVSVTGGGVFDVAATFNVDWGVREVVITDGGVGYTSPPEPSFTDAGSGEEASATAALTDGVVTSVTITSPGGGYVAAAIVTFPAP